jgi:hypothetical protein
MWQSSNVVFKTSRFTGRVVPCRRERQHQEELTAPRTQRLHLVGYAIIQKQLARPLWRRLKD